MQGILQSSHVADVHDIREFSDPFESVAGFLEEFFLNVGFSVVGLTPRTGLSRKSIDTVPRRVAERRKLRRAKLAASLRMFSWSCK